MLPDIGTRRTNVWYDTYQWLVLAVPVNGTMTGGIALSPERAAQQLQLAAMNFVFYPQSVIGDCTDIVKKNPSVITSFLLLMQQGCLSQFLFSLFVW
ncbi:MAG: hypothetical protein SPI30_03400 [Prevotella sp.]|nr:hypothetical protein [Prevotella sp.]